MEWHYATVWKPKFDLDDYGFEPHWWDAEVRSAELDRNEFFRWTLDGHEVARAHIDHGSEFKIHYDALMRHSEPTYSIPFFEVRGNSRRQGIGREAIRQLEDKYPDQLLAAFSENADGFWANNGWVLCARADGDTLFRPLFASAPKRHGAT
jgi:GNAT superfamily N-acetyltransferase